MNSTEVSRLVQAREYTVIPYTNCNPGVRDAAYIVCDLEHNLPPLLKTSYCACVQLKTEVYASFGNLPHKDYAVLSARDDILGYITEFRINDRFRRIIYDRVSVEEKVVNVDRDTVWLFDWQNLFFIRAQFNDTFVTDGMIRKWDLSVKDEESYLKVISDALAYALWCDFRKQAHAEYDFEEKD